jgi:hypothetical protein
MTESEPFFFSQPDLKNRSFIDSSRFSAFAYIILITNPQANLGSAHPVKETVFCE